jgi:hypothetical protein
MIDKPPTEPPGHEREHLGIMFECCRVYNHIYKNKAGDAYVGWCPRCAKKVTIPISPLGTDSRFFKAY